ncbi:hypothetical protein [Rhizohabitans arisaemae]|uniref:hypothetical protein n=1 Tax=Rhizohabitans arisaemae TaxID=2720610 RepID=UPI0024B125AB|nr:hypothetical protein [Rhizohabitans arisaemae]
MATLLSSAAPAGAASAGQADGRIGIRLIEAPVSRRDDPRALAYIVDHLNPGMVIERRFEVINKSRSARRVDLYAGGADIVDGTFTVARDREANELSDWMSLDRDVLQVPAWGRAQAEVRVKVPPAASRGERYAVVWAQTAEEPGGSRTIRTVSRVGIRVYLDVGPGGEPPSDFAVDRLTPERAPDGAPRLVADVRNTGERALDISGSLSLSDGPGGLRAGPFPVQQGVTMSPGSVAAVTVTLDRRVPAGPWDVSLTLRSGKLERTATATVTFPGRGRGRSVIPFSSVLSRYGMLGGLVAVPLALGVVAVVRRRRAARGPAEPDGR